MTVAPERIWFTKVGSNIVPNSKRASPEDVEYVRADLAARATDSAELLGALEDIAGVGFDAPMTWTGTDAEWERRRANAMQAAARAAIAKARVVQ